MAGDMRGRDAASVEAGIEALEGWIGGAVVAALLIAGLWGSGLLGVGPAVAALTGSLLCGLSAELLLHSVVRRYVTVGQMAHVRAVARARARLCSSRTRRRFAELLRSYAASCGRPSPFDVTPHALRAPLVRAELIALADELDTAAAVDPVTMLGIDELLHDGRLSPLLNGSLPASDLVSNVGRLRFRVSCANTGPQAQQLVVPYD
jgi:hypothetical protein